MKIVDEKTLIPIGATLIIFGGSAWLTNMSFQLDAHSKSLESIDSRDAVKSTEFVKISDRLQEIRERLIVIETELKRRK